MYNTPPFSIAFEYTKLYVYFPLSDPVSLRLIADRPPPCSDMNMHTDSLSFSAISCCFLILSLFGNPSNSSPQSFIYLACSQLKYNPGSPFLSNVNSMFASLLNSASVAYSNSFKISLPGSAQSDVVYGLFQCRGDITSNADCHSCVADAVSRIATVCGGAVGGALQYEGCFVRFDNSSFLGVEDKAVVYAKCGPAVGYDSGFFDRRDGVLDYLAVAGQYFRVGGGGDLQGMTQCTQDLSAGECQDCVSAAIQRLKSECGSSAWGDMFLGKCYARYSERGRPAGNGNEEDENEKSLAITIGLVAAVSLLIVFLSCFTKLCRSSKDGKY